MMKPIEFCDIFPRGELGARSSLLFSRLEGQEYRPDRIFSIEGGGWPADWEGRTILALTLLEASTGKESAYLDDIIDGVRCHLNERGYFGHICPGNEVDEQQLSGHSWLLRGLCEYYKLRRSPEVYDIICGITENLFLPAGNAYDSYPAFRDTQGGAESGSIAAKIGRWRLSTDTGCAYIPLDGLSAVYELSTEQPPAGALRSLDEKAIGDMLDVMIINFSFLDVCGLKLQTHATLTCCRGILRVYAVRLEKGLRVNTLLERVSDIFDTYLACGMSAAYANYNWFGRPEWTEPCAIIDSFIVAMQLYFYKNETRYLSAAQKILYNGIGHAQRPNGGFGCDTCVGAAEGGVLSERNSVLGIHCPEAFWCCTMRGGEGLSRAAQYAYLYTDENTVTLPYLCASRARLRFGDYGLTIRQITNYPNEGSVQFRISDYTVPGIIRLRVYLPEWAKNAAVSGAEAKISSDYAFIKLTPETSDVKLTFDIPLHTETPEGDCNAKDKQLIYYGNLILGTAADAEVSANTEGLTECRTPQRGCTPLFRSGDTLLEPINTLYLMPAEQAYKSVYHILF
ncbi:MAG: hypothetical protein WCQ72_03420 [Eubacteriales bacterium]